MKKWRMGNRIPSSGQRLRSCTRTAREFRFVCPTSDLSCCLYHYLPYSSLQIPDDEKGLPQQLCLECYSKCEQWYSFQTMCNEVNDHLVKNLKDPPAETELLVEKTCTVSESEEYMEPLQLEEEEDEVQEEDSLAAYSFGELIRDVDSDNSDHKSKAAAAPEGDGSQCPVCATIMSRGQLLGDHLKAHYSEEVSSSLTFDYFFNHIIDIRHFISRIPSVPSATRGSKGALMCCSTFYLFTLKSHWRRTTTIKIPLRLRSKRKSVPFAK